VQRAMCAARRMKKVNKADSLARESSFLGRALHLRHPRHASIGIYAFGIAARRRYSSSRQNGRREKETKREALACRNDPNDDYFTFSAIAAKVMREERSSAPLLGKRETRLGTKRALPRRVEAPESRGALTR